MSSAPPRAPRRFPRTDAGNAEFFAHLHGDRVRFDCRRQRWLRWSGHRWAPESDGALPLLAVQAARARFRASEAIGDLDDRKRESRFAIDSENRKQVDAALYFAKSLAPISDMGDTWDANPYLLGCPNAIVDLRTGLSRPGGPEDRVTMTTGIDFEPSAQAPRWNQFLGQVFEGDLELIDWIQRAAGYSATGDTREQVWFLKYGSGSNGKGVFDRAIANVLGDYATNTPFATLEAKTRPSIPNDLAALLGRRFVTASESSEASRLNEARIKALTGGDPITARFLNHEFFTFKPMLKLWLSVNHLPRVEDLSYGFWRRVRLVPFQHVFRGQAADRNLDASLRAEVAGILAWVVRGAVAWERQGLEPIPLAVRAATTKYENDSDSLSEFIEERCVVGDTLTVAAGELYRAYDLWATDRGLRTKDERLSGTAFGRRMGSRFHKRSERRGTTYHGIGLAADSQGARGE
jgi:putative DNA primase/helicase